MCDVFADDCVVAYGTCFVVVRLVFVLVKKAVACFELDVLSADVWFGIVVLFV